jgi:hypothetical protein
MSKFGPIYVIRLRKHVHTKSSKIEELCCCNLGPERLVSFLHPINLISKT